jgi:hypothetical protein
VGDAERPAPEGLAVEFRLVLPRWLALRVALPSPPTPVKPVVPARFWDAEFPTLFAGRFCAALPVEPVLGRFWPGLT